MTLQKFWQLLVALSIVQAGILVLLVQFYDINATTTDSLVIEPDSIQLGQVSRNSRHEGEFRITNKHDSSLKIEAPRASCGCIDATIDPNLLPADGQGSLNFTIVSPKEPGKFEKFVYLHATDLGRFWRVPITGEVVDDVVFEPAKIELTRDTLTETFRVSSESLDLREIVLSTSTDELQISIANSSKGSITATLAAPRNSSGRGLVYAMDVNGAVKGKAEAFWNGDSPFSFYPASSVVLSDTANYDVVVLAKNPDGAVNVEPNVDWLRINSTKRISSRGLSVSMQVDLPTPTKTLIWSELLTVTVRVRNAKLGMPTIPARPTASRSNR